VLPGRKTGYLYLLNEKQKVDLLQRQTVDRNAPAAQLKDDKSKDADADSSDDDPKSSENAPPAIREDWWLVRDGQTRVGWVLGRTLYLDVPEEIAQYSEGQRIVASFPLDEVPDGDKKVPEYLVLFTDNKDGMPYDFNQARVYTWNARKHRYETAFREHDLTGVLPVTLGRRDFDKEGNLRTFILRNKEDGNVRELTYKFNPPIVRRVLAPGEEPPKARRKKPNRKTAANH
jgi:hypothetical protein